MNRSVRYPTENVGVLEKAGVVVASFLSPKTNQRKCDVEAVRRPIFLRVLYSFTVRVMVHTYQTGVGSPIVSEALPHPQVSDRS